jgi:hypothetical protein
MICKSHDFDLTFEMTFSFKHILDGRFFTSGEN